ncbi:MAG TPA: flagellar assembly protein A [Sulfuricurvum sp.]|nr:flagellar assembly protein A [Sulfuricurvum sp.]
MQAIKVTASSLAEALAKAFPKESTEQVDFELLSYQTFYRGTVDEQWLLLEESRLEKVTTEVEIRYPSFEIRQEYEFLIHAAKTHPYFNLHFSLAFDKHKSKAIAIIDPRSKIPLKKGIQEYIKNEIHKQKLRSGLLIGITDNDLDLEIKKLLLKIQKEGPLQSPYRMNVTQFFPPIDPINDNVILHYKKEGNENNLIEGVQCDDLILEYIFATPGRSGRNCMGEYIPIFEPLIRYATAITIDPKTIRSEEDVRSIRFYAARSGYVKRQEGVFSISQELRLKGATFRNTGSIQVGSDKQIHVKIVDKDKSKDAVGSGVNIDVQTLDVKGTVGSNTKIQAYDLTVGSQTHKKSLIEVQENATIHLHRGDLKAKNATITVLEAGKVEAQNVHVSQMLGGEIFADHVTIDTLYSNAKITALKSITIQTIIGDGNNLIIDPRSISSYQDQIDTLELKLKEENILIQEKGKELLAKETALKEQLPRIKKMQEKIKTSIAQNKAPLKADMVRVQQYKYNLSELSQQQSSIKSDEEHVHTIEKKLNELYDADVNATITHHGTYNGHTRITFIDPKTSQKYAASPQGNVLHIRLCHEGEDKKIVFES